MKKILLFGAFPLAGTTNQVCSAAGLRTSQFLSVLQERYAVTLFLIGGEKSAGEWQQENTFVIARNSSSLLAEAKKIAHQSQYHACIGVNTFPAFIAAQSIPDTLPFWADLNGWIMAEMQAQAAEEEHNDYLAHGWQQEKTILLRADAISTVSTAQRFAAIGELSALGKLNREHYKKEFVHTIPNASFPNFAKKIDTGDTALHEFRKRYNLPADAVFVAQIGGFNNWLDEETLFHGLEKAMAENPRLHFLSTGGAIQGIATSPFERFSARVATSKYAERFHLLGWIDPEEIPAIYALSSIGILADIDCLETETGARNRLNEMIAYGLPCVTTRGTEIAADIEPWGCGKAVESGNSEALAAALLEILADDALHKKMATQAHHIAHEILSPENTTKPLQSWLEQNTIELLHHFRTDLSGQNILRSGWRFLRERGVKAFLQKAWQRLRHIFS